MVQPHTYPSDPQSTIASALRPDNGEMMVTLSERVTEEIGEKIFYSAGNPRQQHVKLVPLAMDRGSYVANDHLLFSQETHRKYSKTVKILGNKTFKVDDPTVGTGLLPVLNIRRNQETQPRPMKCAAFESIIDHTLQYDPTTQMFHLWYYVYGWTPMSDPWTNDGIDATPPPVASLRYESENARPFDVNRFYVVAQRDILEARMPCAAKVLMFTTGDLVTLYDPEDQTDRPYLLMKAPVPVAYWPFPCSMSSSSRSPSSRSTSSRQRSSHSSKQSSGSSRKQSSKSLSARSRSQGPSHSNYTSRCPTFTGTIHFLCDVTFHPAPDCQITTKKGVLNVQNGLICAGSGCLESSTRADMQAMGFTLPANSQEVQWEGLIVVPQLEQDEISDWAKSLVRASGAVNWKHVVVKGKVDPQVWSYLSNFGAKIHIIPAESGALVTDQVIKFASIDSDVVAVWDHDSYRDSIKKLSIHTIGVIQEEEFKHGRFYSNLVTLKPGIYKSLKYKDKLKSKFIPLGIDMALILSELGREYTRKRWAVEDQRVILVSSLDAKILPKIQKALGDSYTLVSLRSLKTTNKRVIYDEKIHLGDQITASDMLLMLDYEENTPLELVGAMMARVPILSLPNPLLDELSKDKQLYWPLENLDDLPKLKSKVDTVLNYGSKHPLVETAHDLAWDQMTSASMALAWDNMIYEMLEGKI